jgi:Flp pilus assembly pilin Flp
MEGRETMTMQWLGAYVRTRFPQLSEHLNMQRMLHHRQRGSEIAQMAVLTGAVVVVGIGVAMAFMNGLGTFFTSLLTRIQGMLT